MNFKRISVVGTFLLATVVFCLASADADNKHKGKSGHGKNRGHGHNHLSFGPGGLSYTYHNRNFGITIGGGALGLRPAVPVVPVQPPYYGPNVYSQPLPQYVDPYGNPIIGTPANSYPAESQYAPAAPRPAFNPELSSAERNRIVASLSIPSNRAAAKFKSRAETEFRVRNYKEARRFVDYALLEDNQNGHLILFASHISLAMADYERAVIELNVATQRLHQNDWDFFVRNDPFWYPDQEYSKQLKKLDEFCQNEGRDVGFTVRGFHRACDGRIEQAQHDFQTALSLNPEDQLAKRLQSSLQVQRKSYDTIPSASPIVNPPASGSPVEVLPPPRDVSPKRSVLEGGTR